MLTNRAAERLAEIRMRQPWQCVSSQTKLDEAVMVTSGTTVRPPFSFQRFGQGQNMTLPIAEIIDQPLPTPVTVLDVDNRHGTFVKFNHPAFKDNPDRYGTPEQRQALRDRAIITPTGFETEITARTWRELMVAAHALNQKAEAAHEKWQLPFRKRILLDGEIATISNQLWDV